LPSQPRNLRLLRRNLFFLFADQRLLFFRRLDQQRGKPAVIDALSVSAVLLPSHHLRHNRPHFLGDHTDLVLAIRLQVVGHAAKLFDFRECAVQRVDVYGFRRQEVRVLEGLRQVCGLDYPFTLARRNPELRRCPSKSLHLHSPSPIPCPVDEG